MKKFKFLLLIVVIVFSASSVFAYRGGKKDKNRFKGFVGSRYLKKIGVSSENREKIKKIKTDAIEKVKTIKADLKVKKEKLLEEYSKESLDSAKITALQNEIAEQVKQIFLIHSAAKLEAAQLLTQKERGAIVEYLKSKWKRKKGRKGRRGRKRRGK